MSYQDEFLSPRERIEAFPTMLEYCRSRDDEALMHLILPGHYQSNVFGTYRGTQGEHAMDIIRAIRSPQSR
jgi:hypothetical protein